VERNTREVIQKDMILLNQNIESQEEAINQLIHQAKSIKLIKDKNIFKSSVMKREAQASTAVGFNIAMPHGKSETVLSPFIGFLQSSTPFTWGGESVSLIFMIAVPEEDGSGIHLKFISNLSKKLLDEHFRALLEQTSNQEEAYHLLNTVINQ
jgi:PTS system fructose-specific IIA component